MSDWKNVAALWTSEDGSRSGKLEDGTKVRLIKNEGAEGRHPHYFLVAVVAALWKPDEERKYVLSGKTEEGEKVVLMKNNKRDGKKDPDFRLVAPPPEEPVVGGQSTGGQFEDDDVPF